MQVTKKAVPLIWFSSNGVVNVKYMPTNHVKNVMSSLKVILKKGHDPICSDKPASEWLELFKGVLKHRHDCVNQFLRILPKAGRVLRVANQLQD